jgi:putative ABC transport system permease protein
VLTIAIIGLGIMALVGILTAIEVMKASVYSNFSSMGVNSFQITSDIIKRKKHKGGGVNVSTADGKSITYSEAKIFKERFHFPATVGISVSGSNIATARYISEKTNPNVRVTGIDETYMTVTDTKLDQGRNFSAMEIQSGGYVCLLGSGITKKLFKRNARDAVNNVISVGDVKYRVVGVMESKGGSMVMDNDNTVLIPLNTARALYGNNNCHLGLPIILQ